MIREDPKFSLKKAWKEHYKEISKAKGKIIDFSKGSDKDEGK